MEYARAVPELIANTMPIDTDLARLALQEERLQFDATGGLVDLDFACEGVGGRRAFT